MRVRDASRGIAGAEKKISRLASLSKSFEAAGLGQAASTLREIRAVPTIFPQVDQVLGVGGWPTDRIGVIHGESNGGKTEFVLGLILSFLIRDHAALYVDAERTTPPSWIRKLMGAHAEHPGFRALYPNTYEQTTDAVRQWAEAIGDAKAHGKIDKDTTGIVVVDSIRKLVPKKLRERLEKELAEKYDDEDEGGGRRKKGARGIDGYGGRAAQYKAALNAQWMDELVPLMHETGTCFVTIARETEEQADLKNFMSSDDFKVGGGKALYYEAAVVARIKKAGAVTNEVHQTISERHCVQIRKTKIAGKLLRYPEAFFHTSSGLLVPYGFDTGRDLIELGTQLGSVDLKGSSYSLDGKTFGQGIQKAVLALHKDPALFAAVEAAVRRDFMPVGPPETTTAPTVINRRARAKR